MGQRKRPDRLRATYSKHGGVRYLLGAYAVRAERLHGGCVPTKSGQAVLGCYRQIRMRLPTEDPDLRITQIPTPLGGEDRAAGHWWELSMRQVEISRTLVLDDPRRAGGFFEVLVSNDIGIGRPEEVSTVFARRVTKRTREPFGTPVFCTGSEVRIDFRYKRSRVKKYLKD